MEEIITRLNTLSSKISENLNQYILPFWSEKMPDKQNGGFLGRIKADGTIEESAPKAVILNTRLLWSFSRAFGHTKNKGHLHLAERAFEYITKFFKDQDNGGLYWMLNADGSVSKNHKQSYAQAFGIYAFCEYYKASGNPAAKEEGESIFRLLEEHVRDRQFGGYTEALSRKWEEMEDVRLSDVDQNEKKSNNTHLHILEAYTSYHRMMQSDESLEALTHVTEIMMEKIYRPEDASFTLFFTEDWESRSSVKSFGHDIEAAWLITEALSALDNTELWNRYKAEILKISKQALKQYLDGPNGQMGMSNEADARGNVDRNKIWWVQNEAVVGFLNAYAMTGSADYLNAVENIWAFCEEYLIDRKQEEWHFFAQGDGITKERHPYIADEWKCPYHNSRSCIEAIERIEILKKSLS